MRQDIPEELQGPPLQAAVQHARALLSAVKDPAPSLQAHLVSVLAVSPYIADICQRYPDEFSRLLREHALIAPLDASVEAWVQEVEGDCRHWLTGDAELAGRELAGVADDVLLDCQMKTLRRFRHRQLLGILWRDLTGVGSLDDTLMQLSLLADTAVKVADHWAHEALQRKYGQPESAEDGSPQRLVILGMGKLGGHELNVSSDIDLIALWPAAGVTTGIDGKRCVDNGEYFRRVMQRITRLIGAVTLDGFVYRVDTRLRPFGESGPLVMNFDGLENYYLTQGRDWERYAMIKARPITGEPAAIAELYTLLTPFVYRRYLDYNAIDALRELKRKIAESVKRRQRKDDIKLGPGGIREVEFLGQAFQLVRGGREKRLRVRPIRSVLALLGKLEFRDADTVQLLTAAYEFLRRVENALQMMRDEQVHSLPVDELDRLRVCVMLDFDTWDTFLSELDRHRAVVQFHFSALFADADDASQEGSVTDAGANNQHADSNQSGPDRNVGHSTDHDTRPGIDCDALAGDDAAMVLASYDIPASQPLLDALANLCGGSFHARLTSRAQERVERLLGLVLTHVHASSATPDGGGASVEECADPVDTLQRMLGFIRTVAGRSGYLQILIDRPVALARLMRLFARSSWLSDFVTAHPMVIDELIGVEANEVDNDRGEVHAAMMQEAERLADVELDMQMDGLRHVRQARELRIAAAGIDGVLTVMQVSDRLTWLAEGMIPAVLSLVTPPLQGRYGTPTCLVDGEVRPAEVGIVAYGKLGGLELGFGSDLDLVFLHDSEGEAQHTSGNKVVDNGEYFGRLAQKFVHFMRTTTSAGVLYDIDMRLRPNGSSGVLVTGLQAFSTYQHGDAWTWEHQALMRARLVFGNAMIKTQFDAVRSSVLSTSRSREETQKAVANMRERMRDALGSKQDDVMHLKQDAGGVTDIEFIVQYLVLAHAAEHPELARWTDNVRVLQTAARLKLLPAADAEALTSAYLSLRERTHARALQQADPVIPLSPGLAELRERVISIRLAVLGPASETGQ